MSETLKPVRCGCGGEAAVDCLLQPDGFYMAGCYCKNCGTKTIPFWNKEKDKAIDYAVTTWNRAMHRAKVYILPNTSEDKGEMPFCPHCGDELEWE